VKTWLLKKLDYMEQGYLKHGGSPQVFEAQYLAYLECYVSATKGDPNKVWTLLREIRAQETPEGENVRGYSHTLTGTKLVKALSSLRHRLGGPSRKGTLQGAQLPPPVRSEEVMDLFDWLGDSK